MESKTVLCPVCSKPLPEGSGFCPYCMTKLSPETQIKPLEKKGNRQPSAMIILLILGAVIALAVTTFFVLKIGIKKVNPKPENSNIVLQTVQDNTNAHSSVSPEITPENDTGIGLMGVKIDSSKTNLTDTEKLLVQYFDTDYFDAYYEGLQRYPEIYKGTQIKFRCYVTKIISSDDSGYKALVEYGALRNSDGSYFEHTNVFAVISGKHGETHIMQGDSVYAYGIFEGIANTVVDGTLYTVPQITISKYSFLSFVDMMTALYSFDEIKEIASYIFGNDIKLRYIKNEDINGDDEGGYDFEQEPGLEYVCELDNQSNANFTKYRIRAAWGGGIYDLKSEYPVERSLTVSADFNYFYLSVFDRSLNTYVLECYDRNLQKIWSREFTNTAQAVMDYTANHIYFVENGILHIIAANTGEDAAPTKYVGSKLGIRKLEDGILMLSSDSSAQVMKTDLLGNVLWTASLSREIDMAPTVQIVNGNYIIHYGGLQLAQYQNVQYYKTLNCVAMITSDGKIAADHLLD